MARRFFDAGFFPRGVVVEPPAPFSFTVDGEEVTPSLLVSGNTICLLSASDEYPYFDEYSNTAVISDWYTAPSRDEMFFLDTDISPAGTVTDTTIAAGYRAYHHSTPVAANQEKGDMTIRIVKEKKGDWSSPTGSEYRILSCRGVGTQTAASENVLWEVGATSDRRVRYFHESGTDVNHLFVWELPFDLRDAEIYDITATRESGAVNMYLDGFKMNSAVTTTGGTDDGTGTVTASASPQNGANAVVTLQAEAGLGALLIGEALSVVKTAGQIQSSLISTRDARVAFLAIPDADLTTELGAASSIMFVTPNASNANRLNEYVGTYTSTWGTIAPTQKAYLESRVLAKGDLSLTGYRNTDAALHTLGGGADYVWRIGLIFDGGTGRFAYQIGPFGGAGTATTSNGLSFETTDRLRWIQQDYIAAVRTTALGFWDLPFTPAVGDPLLITVGQEDLGGGQQRVRLWVNGVALNVESVSGATDNGDGSVTMIDGLVSGGVSNDLALLCASFGGAVAHYMRFFQVTAGTTDTVTEAAHATAILGATGQV